MFWFRFIPKMFSALSAAFLCSRAFRLFCCSFGCSLFCRLFDFRELNYANFNGNCNQCNGCVSVRYNFLFISLLLFTKVRKTTTWNRHISSTYLSIVEFWSRLTYSVWEFWHYILRQTEWIQLLARFVGWILSRFLIDVVFSVVTVAALAAFCFLGSERLPALSTICLFGCLACVWRFVCRLSFV